MTDLTIVMIVITILHVITWDLHVCCLHMKKSLYVVMLKKKRRKSRLGWVTPMQQFFCLSLVNMLYSLLYVLRSQLIQESVNFVNSKSMALCSKSYFLVFMFTP